MINILHPQKDELIGSIDSLDYWEDEHSQGLDGTNEIQFTTYADSEEAGLLSGRCRLLRQTTKGDWQEFIAYHIQAVGEGSKMIIATGAEADLDRLKVMEPGWRLGYTLEQYADEAIEGTGYQLGDIEFGENKSRNFENYMGAYEFLRRVAELYDRELRFRIVLDGRRVVGRFVDMVERIGADTREELVAGENIIGIKRTVHSDEIVTALYCIGPEQSDGTRLTAMVTDEEAFQRWNWIGKHIIHFYEPQSDNAEMTLEQLQQYGQTELTKRIKGVTEYEVDAGILPDEDVALGDTLRIKDEGFNPPLYAESRVIQVVEPIDYLKNERKYTFGEVKEFSENDVMARLIESQKRFAARIIKSPTPPVGSENVIWMQTETGKGFDIAHTWDGAAWKAATATEAAEIGAATPVEVQTAKEAAVTAANNFTTVEVEKSEKAQNLFVQGYAQKTIAEGPTAPTDPDIGDMWIDTSTGSPVWKRWDGATWAKSSKTSLEELDGVLAEGQIAVGGIAASHIANNAITNEKIIDNAINAQKIAADSITAEKIATGAVTADAIAANSITSNMIVTAGLDAAVIKFGTMSGDRILADTIDANRLKSGTVIANDITFTGMLNGAYGVFSGAVEVSGPSTYGGMNTITLEDGKFTTSSINAQMEISDAIIRAIANNGGDMYLNPQDLQFRNTETGTSSLVRYGSINENGILKGSITATEDMTIKTGRYVDLFTDGQLDRATFGFKNVESFRHAVMVAGVSSIKFLNGSTAQVQFRNRGDTDYVPIVASNVAVSSHPKFKKNIEEYTEKVLPKLLKHPVQTYNMASDAPGRGKTIGLRTDNAPAEVVNEDGETLNLYAAAMLPYKGLTELALLLIKKGIINEKDLN